MNNMQEVYLTYHALTVPLPSSKTRSRAPPTPLTVISQVSGGKRYVPDGMLQRVGGRQLVSGGKRYVPDGRLQRVGGGRRQAASGRWHRKLTGGHTANDRRLADG